MKKVLLLALFSSMLIGCNESKKEVKYGETKTVSSEDVAVNESQEIDGYTLMKNNCYACHNPNTKSHDDIIAPPFVAVKNRYTRQYSSKEEFTNAMIHWVQNPDEEKALMRGAVNEFKVMPKLPLAAEDLKKIGNYIYDNELEQPEWFGAHFKEMHGEGKGMRGKGKGNGKNMKNN